MEIAQKSTLTKRKIMNAATMLFLAGCSGEQVLNNYTPTINSVLQVCVPTEGQTLDLSKSPTFGLVLLNKVTGI